MARKNKTKKTPNKAKNGTYELTDASLTQEGPETNMSSGNKISKNEMSKTSNHEEVVHKDAYIPETSSIKPGEEFSLPCSTAKKRTLLFYIGALILIGSAPKLVYESGMTDFDYAQEFIDSTVRPKVDEMLRMINGTFSVEDNPYFSNNQNRTGLRLKERGARAKYPIAIIPGFVTTGLEFWEGDPCAKKYFRQRVWGGLNMANAFFADRECWRRHITLDPFTGMDPEGIKVRAAQGYEAADYFLGTYWVFAKLIENLADVGYDPNNMVLFPYDWRLAYPLMQQRDGYFSKLKVNIEALVEYSGERAVIMCHSMGASVVLFFLKWVETPKEQGGGGGGSDWVDKNIHAFVNIAGTVLGVPKAFPALMSGEMKDTALIAGPMDEIVEKFFGRQTRKNMFSSWGSLWAMLPKGGDAIWGVGADIPIPSANSTSQATKINYSEIETNNAIPPEDDSITPIMTITNFDELRFYMETVELGDIEEKQPKIDKMIRTLLYDNPHVSLEKGVKFLKEWGGGHGNMSMSSKLHEFGRPLEEAADDIVHWHNPVVTPLPKAPNMKIYCLYGVGRQTERAYYYKAQTIPLFELKQDKENETKSGTCSVEEGQSCKAKNFTSSKQINPKFADPPFVLDTSRSKDDGSQSRGVVMTDGDGSVPVLSQGYMCVSGWVENSHLNPSSIECIVREYTHRESFQVNDPMRGGPYSSEHCDVLGNLDATEDIIKIVTDFEVETVRNKIHSEIVEIAKKIDSHPMGGAKGARQK